MRRGSKGKQKGAVAVTVALSMVFLLGFAALAIDVGNLLVARNELQNSADAAALVGAACLYQRAECNNTTVPEPDWTDAQAGAVSFATYTSSSCANPSNKNLVQGCAIQTVSTASGYWNVTGTPAGLQTPGTLTPGNNDMPAVQVTVTKLPSNANGGIPTFLAGLVGVNVMNAGATATAVISRPGNVGPHSLFPMAMPLCMYNNFWNTATNSPVLYPNGPALDPTYQLETQQNGQAYKFDIGSPYSVTSGCNEGQWTTFNAANNGGCNSTQGDSCIDNMITGSGSTAGGNSGTLSIGDSIFIKSGTASNLFQDTNACSAAGTGQLKGTCEWVSVPVVGSITTGAPQTVVAFACLHILSASWQGSYKYVTVQMSADQSKCTVANSGGVGPNYGAITPPRLVQ